METKTHEMMNILHTHTHTHTSSVRNIIKTKISKTSMEETVKNKIE